MRRRDGRPNRTSAADRAQSAIVGEVLREVRRDAGLSQHAVAEQTGGAVKASLLGSYERGERVVSADRLIELARLYSVDPGVLMSVIERRVQNPRLTGELVTIPTD